MSTFIGVIMKWKEGGFTTAMPLLICFGSVLKKLLHKIQQQEYKVK